MIKELNTRCQANFDASTSKTEIFKKYQELSKVQKDCFFNEASKQLKRTNERVQQMFMNWMKDVRFDHKISAIESATIHNYALVHKHELSVN